MAGPAGAAAGVVAGGATGYVSGVASAEGVPIWATTRRLVQVRA